MLLYQNLPCQEICIVSVRKWSWGEQHHDSGLIELLISQTLLKLDLNTTHPTSKPQATTSHIHGQLHNPASE